MVGAGPGDPGLITVKGAECLGKADLILYDHLVNPAVLKHAPPTAEAICSCHREGDPPAAQQSVNDRMIEAASRGMTVVRLKGGDPDVFSNAAEEIDLLIAAEVDFETVSGVTAATAAAGCAGIPITRRGTSSAVALIIGHQSRSRQSAEIDYESLANFPGTLIFYMATSSVDNWSEALMRRGKTPHTPVMIVRRCSCPDQSTARCTLGTVAEVVAGKEIGPPAVVVVGDVVSFAPEVSWFQRRPLFNRRVMVTRPHGGWLGHSAALPQDNRLLGQRFAMPQPPSPSFQRTVGRLSDRLAELGAEVLVQPAIEISEPADWRPVDHALARLEEFDWLVFSSANGVSRLLDRVFATGGDLRDLGRIRLAAIGPGTADKLAEYHLRADLVPDQYRAEALAEALATDAAGRRFLLARASRGREVLSQNLTAAGAHVEQIVVYSSTDVQEADPAVKRSLEEGRIDWVTVTSSAIAKSLVRLFGNGLRQAKLAAISPITSNTLRSLGHEPSVEATQYTMDGVVDAILSAEHQ